LPLKFDPAEKPNFIIEIPTSAVYRPETTKKKITWRERDKVMNLVKNPNVEGDDRSLQELLTGVHPDESCDGTPLIHWACRFSNLRLVQYLFVNGADLQQRDSDGTLPIEISAYVGASQLVSFFLKNSATIGRAFHIAAMVGDVEILEDMINQNVDVNSRFSEVTAAETAILYGRISSFDVLRNNGRINARQKLCERLRKLRQLNELKEQQEVVDPELLHLAAVLGGTREKIATAIVANFDVELAVQDKLLKVAEPLMCKAIQHTYLTCWEILNRHLARGISNGLGKLPAELKHAIQAKADVNARNAGGWTPLMLTAFVKSTDVAKLLLDARADPYLRNASGQTATLWAEHMECDEIREMLQAQGCTQTVHDEEALGNLKQALETLDEEAPWVLRKQDDALSLMRSLGTSKDNFSDMCEGLMARMMQGVFNRVEQFDFVFPAEEKGITLAKFFDFLGAEQKRGGIKLKEFKDVSDLLFNARLFVQGKVAAGDTRPPVDILCLFVCLNEPAIMKIVAESMFENGKADADKHHKQKEWHSYTHKVLKALRNLTRQQKVVFRRQVCTRKDIAKLSAGSEIFWSGLPLCSTERTVVTDVPLKHELGQDDVSVIFKVHAQSARVVADFSLCAKQGTVVLFPNANETNQGIRLVDARLRVVTVTAYSDFLLREGESLPDQIPELNIPTSSWQRDVLLAPHSKSRRLTDEDLTKMTNILVVVKELDGS